MKGGAPTDNDEVIAEAEDAKDTERETSDAKMIMESNKSVWNLLLRLIFDMEQMRML